MGSSPPEAETGGATLRPARETDAAAIRAIIWRAGLNPLGLKWQRFVVAEADGRVVGTGQIKPHGDGSRELASIAVVPAYQRRGIAHRIITALLGGETGVLYLTCEDRLESFYTRYGFRRIGRDEWTPYFRRLMRFAAVVIRIGRLVAPATAWVIVMKREGD
ncbi:MAG: GNAT family N-acetyltransferase [Anaerolineae bacterium]|nr:GNAT family N-acetyltransferase [Anaerolineae bacterium]